MAMVCLLPKDETKNTRESKTMNTFTAKALKAAISLLLLTSVSACVNTQSAPTMLDYSYVPPNYVASGTPNYGIDDF